MFDQNRERCPEERTKEYVRSHGLREKYNVLWTRDVVVEDIGRQWLAERDLNKRILPDENKFDEYDITHVICFKNAKLNMFLSRNYEYKELYSDDRFVIYERDVV